MMKVLKGCSVAVAMLSLLLCSQPLLAQGYWQQEVKYEMEIFMDVQTNQYDGHQTIQYTNNSPDTLDKVFYYLFFNAFQPGSMMDVRSRTLPDPDPRVGDRISRLTPSEVGFQQIESLKQDGEMLSYEVEGTILEVSLAEPVPPGGSTSFQMKYKAQVPVQIRRCGRDNAEGVRYSMSQWYPRLCEYDEMGWHANPYIGREFHGIWGDFDVKIHIDQDYVLAGTGEPQSVDKKTQRGIRKKLRQEGYKSPKKWKTYHLKAQNVIDFVWAADPEYLHEQVTTTDGIELHFYYKKNITTKSNWEALPRIMSAAMNYINQTYGAYPYSRYSFIQGGDGGMEYPMATLITGERNIGSLVGVSVHELMHNWYQQVLATNESLYPWMDEGFTSYATADVMNHLRSEGMIPGEAQEDPQRGSYTGYINFVQSGREEPLSTHADHFATNAAYGVGSYVKGALFLAQLRYVVGEEVLAKALRKYYHTWKFKHPNDIRFVRSVEKVSGLELDWYREYIVNTTHVIDYSVADVQPSNDGHLVVTLERLGQFPMPIDLLVQTKDGGQKIYHIPLGIMRGAKQEWNVPFPVEIAADWPWTHPTYSLNLPLTLEEIQSITIDPKEQMADVDKSNNVYVAP